MMQTLGTRIQNEERLIGTFEGKHFVKPFCFAFFLFRFFDLFYNKIFNVFVI